MHPTSGTAKTWRRQDREGYWRRRWWDSGCHETRKQHEQLEHRWVWEAAHGQKLPPGYVVHHRDEDPGNNAPENLEALPRRQHDDLHGRPNRQRVQNGVAEKQCSRCEQWFPREHYYTYKGHPQVYCRACCNAYKRARRRVA